MIFLQLTTKVQLLETALNHMIREFNDSRGQLLSDCDHLHEQTRLEILRLQKEVHSKSKECSKIRKLAKRVLMDRSDIERFFLESLEYVREQINLNQ